MGAAEPRLLRTLSRTPSCRQHRSRESAKPDFVWLLLRIHSPRQSAPRERGAQADDVLAQGVHRAGGGPQPARRRREGAIALLAVPPERGGGPAQHRLVLRWHALPRGETGDGLAAAGGRDPLPPQGPGGEGGGGGARG